MPGSARRVRAAYSRTLCLPCLKAGFSAFYTTVTGPYMSSFLFLTFCVYVFCCLGLYFQLSRFQIRSSGGLFPLSSNPPQGPRTGPTGAVWGFGGVISLPGFQNRTQGHTGASLFFLPRTSSPLPLKGEGQDFAHLWGFGFSLAVALATAGHNRATLAQQGRCGASMVSLPYLASKTAHRATQGRVWFWPTGWRFSGGSPSLPAIPCK